MPLKSCPPGSDLSKTAVEKPLNKAQELWPLPVTETHPWVTHPTSLSFALLLETKKAKQVIV